MYDVSLSMSSKLNNGFDMEEKKDFSTVLMYYHRYLTLPYLTLLYRG